MNEEEEETNSLRDLIQNLTAGRYLYIGELKYDVTNIPEDFK